LIDTGALAADITCFL